MLFNFFEYYKCLSNFADFFILPANLYNKNQRKTFKAHRISLTICVKAKGTAEF